MNFRIILAVLFVAACHVKKPDAPQHRIALDTPRPKLEFYSYGLANFDGDRARFRMARAWGFSYRSIAGCEVSRELIDSATRHNLVIEAALLRMHGAGWKARFEKEVEEAIVLDKALQRVAPKAAAIADAQKTLNSQGKGLLFEPTGVRAGNGFEVVAYTYDTWLGKPAYVTQYTMMIDTVASRADVISDERRLYQTLD